MNIDNDEHEHVLICPDCDKTPEELGYAQRQALRDEVMSEIKEQLAAAQTNLDYQTNETHNENLIREWQGAIQGIRFCEEAISTIFEDKQPLKGEGHE